MIRMLPLLCIFLLAVLPTAASGQTMADYTSYPLILSQTVTPSILIMLDNSGSMNLQAYTDDYDATKRYYGYFGPDARYTYSSERFVSTPGGEWGGNFLNWMAMRRIDVERKVLVGGKKVANDPNRLIGEVPAQNGREYWKYNVVGQSPYGDASNYRFLLDDGDIKVYEKQGWWNWNKIATYNINVVKSEQYEPDDYLDGQLVGILQRVGNKARFGLEFFNYTSGGRISSAVEKVDMSSLINDIENTSASTWTPLAEAFYEGVRYFQQVDPYYGNDYQVNDTYDPYYWQSIGDFVWCAKSFILLITDGESTQDTEIPSWLQDYDGDGNDPGTYSDNGSDYLDDVALWAHTTDLRDLEGFQNVNLYTVFAFGQGSDLLRDAAINGGFIDKNGNNLPDLQEEWDANSDGEPDTYFVASEGYELEKKILAAIEDILSKVASGTAVSVLSTSARGEGNLFQAMFIPTVNEGLREVKWIGRLQSLWIDRRGNLREDTSGDNHLVYEDDLIIQYEFDESTGDLIIEKYSDNNGDGEPDSETPVSTGGIDSISPLWEAGKKLALRVANERDIFTFINGGKIAFTDANGSTLRPYLRASDDQEASKIINFIRGEDITGFRDRKLTVAGQPGKVWKLGDIVNSTPTVVGRFMDDALMLYSDESYLPFARKYKDRETVIYVGANDGMLHAFKGGKFHQGDDPNTDSRDRGWIDNGDLDGYPGDELWAYIPYNLLAHLKWLTDENYTHVYYVDLKPRVADVRIFNDDGDHPGGWGTILIGGMRFGGGKITVTDTFGVGSESKTFRSAYFAIDITVPDNPRVLWEFTHPDLGFTPSYPNISKVGDTWYLIVGSGPDDYQGNSDQMGSIFVLNLRTGGILRQIEVDAGAFMASPISVDMELDYDVDVIYIGETYKKGGLGKMLRLLTNESTDPNSWALSTFYGDNKTGPITSPPTAGVDKQENLWVFFGTGRYLSEEDKEDNTPQTFYALKDNGGIAGSLYNATPLEVFDGDELDWRNLVKGVRTGGYGGWYIDLGDGERCLTKPSILGGIVLFTTFTPGEGGICSYGGSGRLYGAYYETGTAYKKPVLNAEMERSIDLGAGCPASIGIHVGEKDTGGGLIQSSTGDIVEAEIDTPFPIKMGTASWSQTE